MTKKNFEALVVASTKRLFRYAQTMYSNVMDAEDLTQETILRMLTKREQFDGKNFTGWSCVVMKSIFLSQMKAAELRRTDDIDKCYGVSSDVSADYHTNRESFFGYLPQPQQQCMRMIVEGYQYNEIAERLNIPIGTVKSRINLARKKIALIERNQAHR